MKAYQAALLILLMLSSVPIALATGAATATPIAVGMPRQAGAGQSSDFIKGLQRELKRAGYDPGLEDGKMGPATRYALRRFQEDLGLAATGRPDLPTLTKLLEQSLRR